jgi:hypothetical protein
MSESQYTFAACICCWNGCDFDNIVLCSKGHVDCLCFTHQHCLVANVDPLPIGMATAEGEICKISLFCCDLGLKRPAVLIAGATQHCCFTEAAAFPFDDQYLSDPVCAFCFLMCMPELGCCRPPPKCKALLKIQEISTPASQVISR